MKKLIYILFILEQMKKLLIISFYELKDYFLCIKEQFEESYYTVIEYPLFKYAYDSNDRISDYKEHLNQYIQDKSPDIILWWFIDVPVDVFRFIKKNNPNSFYIMYNSDDPFNMNKDLFEKAKIFDVVATPCKESMYMYKLYSNVKYVVFNPMGYDEKAFFPIGDNTNDINEKYMDDKFKAYSCDISMMFYNLCLDPNSYPDQVVGRKELIEQIIILCKKKNYRFKIYGTHALREFFPEYYFGEVAYNERNLMYCFSKINLISSPFKSKSLNIDEQTFSILGSGGLLMIDRTKDIDKLLTDCGNANNKINNGNCIIYNSKNYLDRIEHILDNYANYNNVKINGYILSKKYTWKSWTENIIRCIGTHFFDETVYANLYDLHDLKLDKKELLDRWLDGGLKRNELCFDFRVPDNFNHLKYIDDNPIKKDMGDFSPKYAYYRWYTRYTGQDDDQYMKRIIRSSNDARMFDTKNVPMEDYYDICSILNKVIRYNTRDIGLQDLHNYSKRSPNLPINMIVSNYVENVL